MKGVLVADVYYGWTLRLIRVGLPGEVQVITVRARNETAARGIAARHYGREGRAAWRDPAQVSIERSGMPAIVQHAGVLRLHAS